MIHACDGRTDGRVTAYSVLRIYVICCSMLKTEYHAKQKYNKDILATRNQQRSSVSYLSTAVVLMHRPIMSLISASVTFSNASGRIPYNTI